MKEKRKRAADRMDIKQYKNGANERTFSIRFMGN